MNKRQIVFAAAVGLGLLLVVWLVGGYNSLIGSRNNVDRSWSRVETQYQRRYDLIGNLVATVEGAQVQEREVFGQIADARSRYSGARSPEDQASAASSLEGSLGRLLVITENYPQLRSNDTVLSLQKDLRDTESLIADERNQYNDAVNRYNTSIQRFPRNLLAGLFGFESRTLFKTQTERANVAPTVRFGSGSGTPR